MSKIFKFELVKGKTYTDYAVSHKPLKKGKKYELQVTKANESKIEAVKSDSAFEWEEVEVQEDKAAAKK